MGVGEIKDGNSILKLHLTQQTKLFSIRKKRELEERATWYFLYLRVKPKWEKRYNQNPTPFYFITACNSQFKKIFFLRESILRYLHEPFLWKASEALTPPEKLLCNWEGAESLWLGRRAGPCGCVMSWSVWNLNSKWGWPRVIMVMQICHKMKPWGI